jgi:hypothetical protein
MDEINDIYTTTTSASTGALSLDDITKAIADLPKPQTYMRLNGKEYPIKDFSLSLAPPELHIDEATGPDHTILTTWQQGILRDSFKALPSRCSWGVLMSGCMADGSPGRFIPYTIYELRNMRKCMRDSKGKRLLKEIARNPALCQQDPRKLRRIARRKAEEIQRITGEKTTFKVYNRGRYGTADPC